MFAEEKDKLKKLGPAFCQGAKQLVRLLMSPIGMPVFDSQLWLLTLTSWSCTPWEAKVMAQELGSLPRTWQKMKF